MKLSLRKPQEPEHFLKLILEGKIPGLSGKSQVLFALVFTARYLDLVTTFISPYNTIMKVGPSLM